MSPPLSFFYNNERHISTLYFPVFNAIYQQADFAPAAKIESRQCSLFYILFYSITHPVLRSTLRVMSIPSHFTYSNLEHPLRFPCT
jgi:hypothetical protein